MGKEKDSMRSKRGSYSHTAFGAGESASCPPWWVLPQGQEWVWLHSARGSCASSLPAAALRMQGEPGLM